MLLQLFYFSTWSVSLEISMLLGKLNQAFFSTLLDFANSVKIPIFLPNHSVEELGLSGWQNLLRA